MAAHIPERPGPFAGLILVHGGGWSAGDKQAAFVIPLFGPLDRSGLAWFTINYRLTPASPHPAALRNVAEAIRDVKKHALEVRLDPARIAIMGESAGGHPVGLAATDSQPNTGGDTQNQPFIRLGSADLPLLFGGGGAADIANGDSVPPHLGQFWRTEVG